MSIPIVSRLSFWDYQRIVLTFLILVSESLLRLVMLLVPMSVFDWVRFHIVTRVYPRIFKGFHDEDIKESRDRFYGLRNTPDLIRAHGYHVEEHALYTADGYLLVVHRVGGARRPRGSGASSASLQSDQSASTAHTAGSPRPAVLLMHGCMMSSEVWVCLRSAKKCLPLVLADAGYDVWLGNVRGNKYCQKHATLKPNSAAFWDFSLDEIALHDIPAAVEYILGYTRNKTISYIGFSQGSSVGFAALSMSRKLDARTNVMIALAATTKPKGMVNKLVQALTKASPELIYLAFSRRIFLPSITFWKNVLSPRAYTALLDYSIYTLFGWTSKNLKQRDRLVAFQHLYAFTSSKLIAHWFQIMRAKRFQMYEEEFAMHLGEGPLVPSFPLDLIRTPIALFLGGKDTLVDNHWTKDKLKGSIVCVADQPDYEHLDFLWGHDVDEKVYPVILHLLRTHNSRPAPEPQ